MLIGMIKAIFLSLSTSSPSVLTANISINAPVGFSRLSLSAERDKESKAQNLTRLTFSLTHLNLFSGTLQLGLWL